MRLYNRLYNEFYTIDEEDLMQHECKVLKLRNITNADINKILDADKSTEVYLNETYDSLSRLVREYSIYVFHKDNTHECMIEFISRNTDSNEVNVHYTRVIYHLNKDKAYTMDEKWFSLDTENDKIILTTGSETDVSEAMDEINDAYYLFMDYNRWYAKSKDTSNFEISNDELKVQIDNRIKACDEKYKQIQNCMNDLNKLLQDYEAVQDSLIRKVHEMKNRLN